MKTLTAEAWTERWLTAVQDGSSAMSQRTLDSIEKNGGLAQAKKVARVKGVHLLLLTTTTDVNWSQQARNLSR